MEKITINGFDPELVIADMEYGMSGYCPFKNIFITRKNIFICLHTQVYADIQDIYTLYGNGCDFFFVERRMDVKYHFDFGNIFKEKAFVFYPSKYNDLLKSNDNFIRLGNSCVDIRDLKSTVRYYAEAELEKDIKLIDSIIDLKSLSKKELENKRDKAVRQQDYLEAVKFRNELNKR